MFSLRNVITIVTVFTCVMLPCSEASISGQGPRMALNADVYPDTVMDDLDTVVDDLDIFVNTVMACRDIAGLNLVVVAKGNVLLSKGYGVRRVNASPEELVTGQTLFGIASLTKAFTTTLLGIVLENHPNFNWESRVVDILPDFLMDTELLSRQVTVRDVASHAVGLGSNNYLRFQTPFNRAMLARKLRYLEVTGKYRASLHYNNILYGLLAHLTETVSGDGKTWEELLQEKIFCPLEMKDTTFTHTVDTSRDDLAHSCMLDYRTGQLREVDLNFQSAWGAIGGSGSIMSHGDDMSKWMLCHLSGGRNQAGEQVIPEVVMQDTYRGENWIPDSSSHQEYRPPSAPVMNDIGNQMGLGWRRGSYRGYQQMLHTGTSWGYASLLTVMHDTNISVYTNVIGEDSGYHGRRAIHMYVLDLLLGEQPWLNASTTCDFPPEDIDNSQEQYNQDDQDDQHVIEESPLTISYYVGLYGNYAYGNITISLNSTNDKLLLLYGEVGTWQLQALEDEPHVFYARGYDLIWSLDLRRVEFSTSGNNQNEIDTMTIPDFQGDSPPVFVKDLDISTAPLVPFENPCISINNSATLDYYQHIGTIIITLLSMFM